MFTVCMRTDENFMTTEIFSQFQSCGVRNSRIDICTLREALHHVVEQHAIRFVVQILGGHEITVDCFRLTVDACDQLPTITFCLPSLSSVSHHRSHAAFGLTSFVICEAYDCHGHHRLRSAISRIVMLMPARS